MVSTEKVSCIIFEIVWHWNLFTWIYSALLSLAVVLAEN